MSLFVNELQQVAVRIVALAPTEPALKDLFERLTFELTSGLGEGQQLDLAATSLPEGPVRFWASFTLGRRAGLDVRLSLIGATLEGAANHPVLLEISDLLLLAIPPDALEAERLLSLKVPLETRSRPLVVAGLDETMHPSREFQKKALQEWIRRHFDQVRHLPEGEKFLAEGLEWALSF